ncbi:MAG: hypothetical protein JWQ49_3350 [Edaphobacter sp.]|nr:hypothetical protein [Edaphobacter sp.]
MKRQRKAVLEARAALLILAIGITPAGRRAAISTFGESIRISETATELPCRIVTGFRNLSPDRLDPTCPECI